MISEAHNLRSAVRHLVIATVLVGAAGCTATAPLPSPTPTEIPTFLMQGSVTVPIDYETLRLIGVEDPEVGSYCSAAPGYADIAMGGQVVVEDENGKTIATGVISLKGGEVWVAGGALLAQHCRFTIDIYNVPTDAEFYSVHVGNTFRGETQYTFAQAKQGFDLFAS